MLFSPARAVQIYSEYFQASPPQDGEIQLPTNQSPAVPKLSPATRSMDAKSTRENRRSRPVVPSSLQMSAHSSTWSPAKTILFGRPSRSPPCLKFRANKPLTEVEAALHMVFVRYPEPLRSGDCIWSKTLTNAPPTVPKQHAMRVGTCLRISASA